MANISSNSNSNNDIEMNSQSTESLSKKRKALQAAVEWRRSTRKRKLAEKYQDSYISATQKRKAEKLKQNACSMVCKSGSKFNCQSHGRQSSSVSSDTVKRLAEEIGLGDSQAEITSGNDSTIAKLKARLNNLMTSLGKGTRPQVHSLQVIYT